MGRISKISQVAVAIGVLVVIWSLIQGIRGCQQTVRDIVMPVAEREDPKWGKPRAMVIKPPLIGRDEKPRLEITIPPHEDTIRLQIPGGEAVYGLPENAELHVVKIPAPIIRMNPNFHLTGLTDFRKFYVGLKIRFVTIWRFGMCGYLAICGPGVGCDFQIFSNVSIGAVYTLDKWYGEVSLKI